MRVRVILAALLVWLGALAPVPVLAVEPDEVLADPAQEARARNLSAELRCMVCQNQSIDDSNAPLARDLRLLLRERIVAGDTDEQVMAYLVGRYGDFILLRPRFAPYTLLLWLTPVAMLALGAVAAVLVFRRRRAPEPSLTADEDARLKELLAKEDTH